MKFVVVNVLDESLAESLCEKYPHEVGLYHKLMEVLCLRGLSYMVQFFDRDDPLLMDQFKYNDRFIYGLRSVVKEDV